MEAKNYRVTATVYDPVTSDNDWRENAKGRVNMTRKKAIRVAQQWAREGYFSSVYDQTTGECIDEYESGETQ